MDYIAISILGLVIGSFLNVCIYRIPREESISYPPSHCGNCDHKLGIPDLLPLISYAFLRGKCRYCKAKISLRYPMIESLNGILYLLIYMNYGLTLDTAKYCVLASLLIVIGSIDFNTQYVYTSTTIFGAIVGISFFVGQSVFLKNSPKEFILGGLLGFAIIGAIVFITKGMGQGDIEIAAVCGLFLGVKGILFTLFMGIVIAGIAGIIILALKLKNAKDKMAFGPFLALGAIMYMLCGNQIIQIYLNYVLNI